MRWGHGISRRWIPAFGAWSRELTEKKMASDRAPEFLGSRYLAGQRARAAVRRKEAELIDLRRFPNGRRVRWMGGSASDARWVVRARTHLCRTTADARRRSRPRTQQALHSRWNFTALEELCSEPVLRSAEKHERSRRTIVQSEFVEWRSMARQPSCGGARPRLLS